MSKHSVKKTGTKTTPMRIITFCQDVYAGLIIKVDPTTTTTHTTATTTGTGSIDYSATN